MINALRKEVIAAPAYHFSEKPYKIKLDQNESPFALPKELQEQLKEQIGKLELNRYPELNAHSVRSLLAEQLDWSADGIVLSSGSNVLIQALVMAAGIGQSVLTVDPTFSVYSMQAELLGADLISLPLNDNFSLPVEDLKDKLSTGQGVFFLANPSAPTANLIDRSIIEELAEASKDNWLFVIDEAYHQFSQTDFSYLVNQYEHVICLRTFSKAFGLGGVRLGYALMQTPLATHLQKLIMPFSISILQLAIAELILNHSDYTKEHIHYLLSQRDELSSSLSKLNGVEAFKSDTNFILFRVGNASEIYNALLEEGVLIRRQDHLAGLTGCLRVAVGTSEENQAFLKALERALP